MGSVVRRDFRTKAGLEEEKMREREGEGRMGREDNRQRRVQGFQIAELAGGRREELKEAANRKRDPMIRRRRQKQSSE